MPSKYIERISKKKFMFIKIEIIFITKKKKKFKHLHLWNRLKEEMVKKLFDSSLEYE